MPLSEINEKYPHRLTLEFEDEAQKLAVQVLLQEGALRFKEQFIQKLVDELNHHLETAGEDGPNVSWVYGMEFALQNLHAFEVDINKFEGTDDR